MLMKRARIAATCLGITIFLVVMFVYLPTLIVHPADIGNELSFFVDTLLFSGAAFLLADTLPQDPLECEKTG